MCRRDEGVSYGCYPCIVYYRQEGRQNSLLWCARVYLWVMRHYCGMAGDVAGAEAEAGAEAAEQTARRGDANICGRISFVWGEALEICSWRIGGCLTRERKSGGRIERRN